VSTQLQLNIKSVTDLWNAISMYVTDQEERSRSVDAFRKGQKDVLVATDVASKGLDFADVQHVINYDMPDDVENYGEFDMLIV
jgi:superfamily II DNA helicase RecQ